MKWAGRESTRPSAHTRAIQPRQSSCERHRGTGATGNLRGDPTLEPKGSPRSKSQPKFFTSLLVFPRDHYKSPGGMVALDVTVSSPCYTSLRRALLSHSPCGARHNPCGSVPERAAVARP